MSNLRHAAAVRLALLTLLLLCLIALPTLATKDNVNIAASSGTQTVVVVELNVQIDPGSSGLVARAISQAESSGAAAVIIDMNTPGGLLSDMVSIVNSIQGSSVPVYTYVSNGSLAASAGSYIAMATRVIFMGPGSQIGPSTPIVVGGTSLEQNHTESAMLSLMTSLALQNGRNATAAYDMVIYDVAYSYDQALQYHVADRSSYSLSQTLQDLNLSSASIVTISESPTEQLLSTLSNPTLDGILLLLGIVAIALDFLHPTILLSVAGGVLIILALIGGEAIQGSSESYAVLIPVVLFAVAATLIIFEIKTGHGFLLFSGVAVGAVATLLLAYQVPYSPSPFGDVQYIELALLLIGGGVLALYARWVAKSIREKPVTGKESIIGRRGIVYSEVLDTVGEISIDGVIWKASSKSSERMLKGTPVIVSEVSGLTLVVEPEPIKGKV
ncbi:MAG: NfeD family protein [Nitrososphaerales archaeon]